MVTKKEAKLSGTIKPSNRRIARRPIQPPRNTLVMSGQRTAKASSGKDNPKKNERKKVRAAEVTIRQSASPGQIVYGTMRIGGVYTFLDTNINDASRAYARTGDGNYQIVWIAKEAGAGGNDVSITLVVAGTQAATSVSVVDKSITVTCKSNAGVSAASANSVITAVQNSAAAMALLNRVHAGEGTGTANVQGVSETFLTGGGGTWLHHVITLAAHEIQSVQNLYLDDREVLFGASPDPRWSVGFYRRRRSDGNFDPLVFMAINRGFPEQEAQPDLIGQLPTRWTTAHRQRGCAHAYIITVYDDKRFPQGLPEVAFKVQGKPCYDPRTGTVYFTNNAALVIADYLTNTKWGMGVSWDDIDVTSLSAAANVCDELVTLIGGVTEKRYVINGAFDTSESPADTLNEMADAMAGDIIYQGGKWRILPGKWRAPDISLSRDDTRGTITVSTRRSRRDSFNCVRGTIASENHAFEPIDFPAIKVPSYITEDGREIYTDLPLNFVTSQTQAQRIARIRLGQIRQPIVIEATFTLKALSLQVGDVIQYTDSVYGWTNKAFEVRDFAIENDVNAGILVKVVLTETAEAIYTWTSADQLALDPAPNSSFPSYSDIEPPTELMLESGTNQLYVREDGTVFTRLKVTWTHSTIIYVKQGGKYDIQYKKASDVDWITASSIPAESNYTYILDVHDGVAYDVQVRAVSAIGVYSDWVAVTNYVIVGKTEPPSIVPTFAAGVDAFGIQLAWTAVPDLDVKEYEIRVGGTSWETASFLQRVQGTSLRTTIRVAGTWTFRIKAVDTSGNFSVSNTTTQTLIGGPQAPIVSILRNGSDYVVSWTAPASQFSIDYYEVGYGAEFASREVIGTVKGTTFNRRVDWGGQRRFWVVGYDVAGNAGAGAWADLTIVAPGPVVGLKAEVVDSNVKLDWEDPATGTLPIDYYEIRKGATYATAQYLGQVSASFTLNFETMGGTYTYWVTPVDTAGTSGTPQSTLAVVNSPNDLVILANTPVDLTSVDKANMVVDQSKLLGPVKPTETWTDHFSNNSFATPQDQIDAGLPLYPQPGPDYCGLQKVHDYGTLLPVGYIEASVSRTLLYGTPNIVVTIWYSPDNSTWYGGVAGDRITASVPFRYVKVRVTYGVVPGGTFS